MILLVLAILAGCVWALLALFLWLHWPTFSPVTGWAPWPALALHFVALWPFHAAMALGSSAGALGIGSDLDLLMLSIIPGALAGALGGAVGVYLLQRTAETGPMLNDPSAKEAHGNHTP